MSAAHSERWSRILLTLGLQGLALMGALMPFPAAAQALDLADWSRVSKDGVALYVPHGERGEAAQLIEFELAAGPTIAEPMLAQLSLWVQQSRTLAAAGKPGPVERLEGAAGVWRLQVCSWMSGSTPTFALLAVLPGAEGGRRVVFVGNSAERFKRYVPVVLVALKSAPQTAAAAASASASTAAATGSTATQTVRTDQPLIGVALPLPGDLKRLRIGDLTGIWTADTAFRNQRIEIKEKTDHFAEKVTVTTSVVEDHALGQGGQYLKVRPDGRYEYGYAFSLKAGCWSRQSHEGRAELVDGVLTLSPGEMRDATEAEPGASGTDCPTTTRRSPGVPQRYRLDVAPAQSFYGLPTYALWPTALDNAGAMGTLVRVESRPRPAVALRSPQLEAPTLLPGRELTGTWRVVAAHGADPMDKVAPSEGRYEARLSIVPGGRYELSMQLPNVAHFPLCRRKLVLVERGSVRQSTLRIQPNDRTAASGSLELYPTQSELTDEVTQCGPDNAHRQVQLPPAPRHYVIRLVMADGITGRPGATDQLFLGFQDRDDSHRTQWEFLTVPDVAGLEFGGYRRQ